MATAIHRVHHAYDEYVAFESSSNVKHEYFRGQIYAMAGGTPEHAALAAAVIMLLGAIRGGACRAYTSDLRVLVASADLATYPDVTVVCGPLSYDPKDALAVVNPTLLVEVTSKSTEEYDRTEKLEAYKQISTLRQCVIVSHRERAIEVWTLGGEAEGGWSSSVAREGDVAELASIDARLDVRALYDAAGV
ncbi:MAG: Uma2 family endonuclease [Polyangiales bacterium]